MIHILLALHLGAFNLFSGFLPIIPNAGVLHSLVDYFSSGTVGGALMALASLSLCAFGLSYEELCTKIGTLHKESGEIVARNVGVDKWPSEDEVKFDNIHAAIRQFGDTKRRLDLQKQVEDDLSKTERQTEPNEIRRQTSSSHDATRGANVAYEDWDKALRAWMLTQQGQRSASLCPPEWRAIAQKLGVNLNSDEFPFRYSSVAPTSVRSDRIAEWERRSSTQLEQEHRALTLTTTGGGYLVSPEANRALEEARLYFGPMLRVATIIRTNSGAQISIPTTNNTTAKGRILGINTQITLTDPAVGQVLLGAFKYSSDGVLVPEELLQDSGVNIADLIFRILGERLGRILNEHFTTGTGTTQPNGIVPQATAVNLGTGTAAGFGSTTDGTAYRNILKVLHAVDIAYRNGPSVGWMMNDAILQTLAGMVDSTGRPLWVPSLIGGEPDRLLGYPIYINNEMTGTFANNARTVLFGDFSKYFVREVRDTAILSSRERYIDFHQTLFLAFSRYDGGLVNAGTGPVRAAVHQT